MACLEGTAKSSAFIVISMTPDVCKSPGAPIPYNIVGFLSDSILTSTNVRFQKRWVYDTMSRVATVIGNEAGIGGGVVSQTNQGMCKPVVGPSSTVFCNGNRVCRHETTLYEMNMLGPEGASNTLGKVIYLGAMMSGPVGPKGCLPASANSTVAAQTPAEVGPLDKIKNSLSINSVEDAVALSQRAYDLAQVDWSNPTAALGALGGMANRAGFGDLAKGFKLANKAMNTDWSDPIQAISSAAALAGPALDMGKAALELGSQAWDYLTKPIFEQVQSGNGQHAIVLVGGGMDAINGNVRDQLSPQVQQDFPDADIMYVTWDGDSEAAAWLDEYRRQNPNAEVTIFGHSYGGDSAMQIADQVGPHVNNIDVVTLDPVAHWKTERPNNVEHWDNVYVPGIHDSSDVIATGGGHWGKESKADSNTQVPIADNPKDQITHGNALGLYDQHKQINKRRSR